MCSRFVRISPLPIIAKKSKARQSLTDLAPSHNIAPNQEIAIINDEGFRQLIQCKWGIQFSVEYEADSETDLKQTSFYAAILSATSSALLFTWALSPYQRLLRVLSCVLPRK